MDEIREYNDKSAGEAIKGLQLSINADAIYGFAEQIKGIAKFQADNFRPIQEAMQRIQNGHEVSKSFERIQTQINSINSDFKDSFDRIGQVVTAINNVFPKSFLQGLAETQEQFRITVERINENMREFQRILFSLGWFPVGDWDVRHERHILKLYKEKKIKEIDKLMLTYFTRKKISEILQQWSKSKRLKRGRLRILVLAVNAHLRKEYAVSIIVLLTQIEGEMRGLLKQKGKINYGKFLKEYKSKIKAAVVVNTFEDVAVEGVCDSILNRVFRNHGVDRKTGRITFSRHSVIHGMNLNDYNRVESTKLILLMNYIISGEFLI